MKTLLFVLLFSCACSADVASRGPSLPLHVWVDGFDPSAITASRFKKAGDEINASERMEVFVFWSFANAVTDACGYVHVVSGARTQLSNDGCAYTIDLAPEDWRSEDVAASLLRDVLAESGI